MDLHELDFYLPHTRVAQFPAVKRDCSRMMVYSRQDRKVGHSYFFKLAEFLEAGDLMVLNDSVVIKARVTFRRPSGGRMEILFLSEQGDRAFPDTLPKWECLIRSSGKVRQGDVIEISTEFMVTCIEQLGDGRWIVECHCKRDVFEELESAGEIPLPPYIRRKEGGNRYPDDIRYQTVFGKNPGSVAAPTAGLHFTETLITEILERGVTIVPVTMKIGYGTFAPIREERVEDHRIHSEFFSIPAESARVIREQKQRGGRIIAVGTSVVRTLETAFDNKGEPGILEGHSDLFIHPGYAFKIVNGMITNFHLPRSSLIALVMAFCGVKELRRCYDEAVAEKYRFFSYGDVMLIT